MTKTKKNIFYWSPALVDIATNKSVINSIYSLNKFSNKYECQLINFFGEFERFREEINEKRINVINYFNKKLFLLLPKYGKIKSRFSFTLIFLLGYLPLKNLLKKNKPDFLIIHLISSLPLFLLLFNKFETKFILRVSGLPHFNLFRKFLWKITLKKIHFITCPTNKTKEMILNLGLANEKKIHVLYDPVIEVSKFSKKKLELNKIKENEYYFAAGRLTKQKNFLFLCKCFKKLVDNNKKLKLIIAGDGEYRQIIHNYILKNNLQENIFLIGHTINIFSYMYKSKGFILSSIYEDPGFVLIESAMLKKFILTSDCPNGPNELIQDNFNGIVFNSNSEKSFLDKFKLFSKMNENLFHDKQMLINSLKMIKKFTIFNHYQNLNRILNN